jgi:hypothetical protein
MTDPIIMLLAVAVVPLLPIVFILITQLERN